jgi:hypothetical protein
MISPELLRRYPAFGNFNDAELRALALIAEEANADVGNQKGISPGRNQPWGDLCHQRPH